jgi:hypothetical protein
MTHTVESLMALHHAATAAALQYADCARVSLRSARSMQAADDRNEANDAILAALTEALQERDTAQGMATAWKLTHDKVLAAAPKGAV